MSELPTERLNDEMESVLSRVRSKKDGNAIERWLSELKNARMAAAKVLLKAKPDYLLSLTVLVTQMTFVKFKNRQDLYEAYDWLRQQDWHDWGYLSHERFRRLNPSEPMRLSGSEAVAFRLYTADMAEWEEHRYDRG